MMADADASTLVFGANKGGIYAVNRADGKLRWQYKIHHISGGALQLSERLEQDRPQ